MACPPPDVLGAFLAAELPADERARLVDHAATCEPCRAVVAAIIDSAPTPGSEPTLAAAAAGDDVVIEPGERVGRYVIAERLGVGGMGVVYAAVDSELHRRVAVKLLRDDREAGFGSQGRERLLREARTLAKLSHPNVVTVFDVGMRGDQLYIAMELVQGGNLSAWLRRAPRTTREIVDRMREAGAGLAAAHAAGVIHRDVKPDNILVGEDGRARMTDFGLARSSEIGAPTQPLAGTSPVPEAALTRTHALVGTPVYMAPEQLAGASADVRSDQWSFCATLYEAVAGVRPFAPGDVDSRRSAIKSAAVAAPVSGRRVPSWVRRIALRGLKANPAERWPSVAAIVDALGRRSRQRRAVFVLAGLLVAALVAVVVALTRDGTGKPKDLRVFFAPPDTRPGCDCPYSACVDGTCLSECSAHNFRLGTRVPGITRPGDQEVLLGASLAGDAILYATGEGCNSDRLMLARRRGSTFVPVDLTDRITALLGGGRRTYEGTSTLAADGRSIITVTPDRKGFVRARLDGDDEIVELDRTELAQVAPALAANQTVATPVLSADQLTLYFSLNDYFEDGDMGPLNGAYESTRTDLVSPFPAASRVRGGRVKSYGYITGVSADGLTLFITDEYATRVLVRPSTRDLFGDLGPNVTPPYLYGWRTIPLAGCHRFVTTDTPGGCAAEDIVFLEEIPHPAR